MIPNSQYTSSPLRNKSPVHHLKSPGYYQPGTTASQLQQSSGQSKLLYSSSIQQKEISPIKQQPIMTEADLYKSKCNELDANLTQVKTDLEIANYKARKSKDMEEKCDLILKQNQSLLEENDRVQKQLNDKNTESQIWKEKCDKQMNSLIQMKATYELDLKKAYTENQKLKETLSDVHTQKQRIIEDTKNSAIINSAEKVENLKKSYAKNTSLYEEQQRKLYDIIDQREREIEELKNKIQHLKAESELEIQRINDDREKLRKVNADQQKRLQIELDSQKMKSDDQYNQQTNNLKSLHSNEIDILENEIKKLKKLLETKNVDIQQLILQNQNQKRNFDSDNEDLKREILALKEKLKEIIQLHESESNDLKEKLATLHTTDITELKNKHESIVSGLKDEINNLSKLLDNKSEELEVQIKEKQQQRDSYNLENQRLKQEIDDVKYHHTVKIKDEEDKFNDAQKQIETAQSAHNEFSDQLKNQIKFLNSEIENLKQLLVKKNNELDENIAKFQTYKAKADEDMRLLQNENEEWKRQFDGLENEKNTLLDEDKMNMNKLQNDYTDKFRKLEFQNNTQENQIRQLTEQLHLSDVEITNLKTSKEGQNLEIMKLKSEIDSLAQQLLQKDQMKIEEVKEIKSNLEKSNEYAVSTLQVSHQNQLNMLKEQINSQSFIIQDKDNTIQKMAEDYNKLLESFEDLNANKDKLDDYEKRIQLLNAEVVTTKNLYDVFLKTKSRFGQKKQ